MSKIKNCCIFLLFCCILLGSVSFAARTHTHNYTILLSRVEPTCTEDGYKVYKCEQCNSTNKTELKKLGHDFSGSKITILPRCDAPGQVELWCVRCCTNYTYPYGEGLGIEHIWKYQHDNEPTCVLPHEKVYYCSNCVAIWYQRVGDPLGHDLEDEVVVEKQATCTEDGLGYKQCKRIYHDGTRCTYREEVTIPKTGHHKYEQKINTVEPTCEKAGYDEYKCLNCDSTTRKTIKKLDHNYSEFVKRVEPTCKKAGYTQYKCSNCEATIKQSISKLDHNYSAVKRVEPTDSTSGYIQYKCSMCGGTKKTTLPKLNTTKVGNTGIKAKDNKTNLIN